MATASNQDIRNVAENLLRSSGSLPQNIQSQNVDLSQSHSINTVPSIQPEYVISEDLFAGQRLDGNMSNVRRFFCLFVTFDLAFTSLMWLVCVMLNGENIATALSKQIYHYNIHTSLFDVVLAGVCRFVVLILFYAIIYINHWIIISLSTTATCAFLIAKVFQYDWTSSHQPVFEVLLILTSFVISWGEAWFLDFRVIPQELHARRYLVRSGDNERAPLIRSYVQGLPSMYTESVGNFYSPLCSPEGSVHGFIDHSHKRFPPARFTKDQEDELRSRGANVLQESWHLSNNKDWKQVKQHDNGDIVYVLTLPKVGKMFKLTATVDISPQYLLEELFYKIENIAHWNPSLLESHKIQTVDEYTDISYQISADAVGVVSSRDFVNLRHWGIIDGCYVIASVSTEHPSLPKNEKYIRGENGIGCWVMRSLPDDSEKCNFSWVLNTNLKGWIPNYILETALIGMMFDYVKYLRRHIVKLHENRRIT